MKESATDWSPAASIGLLKARARINEQIRAFFREKGVLEVETPLLCHATGTDPNIESIAAHYREGSTIETRYLQTSPEFAMKRLLAAGSGPIYQLCKAFRNAEHGRRHNPEFSMLEWYRPGFTLEQMMDEVESLLIRIAGIRPARRITYRSLFEEYLDVNPHTAPDKVLRRLVATNLDFASDDNDRDVLLELLYSHLIEPRLQEAVFIHDYPASQAALARVLSNTDGDLVGRRFELVAAGMELANGYDELCDPAELAQKFATDQAVRESRGLARYPEDTRLLAALEHGMPQGAGVAMGVDRVLMLAMKVDSIQAVLNFPHDRA